MRELVRAREATMPELRRARQQLQSFLLRQGRIYTGRAAWTKAHARWLSEQAFTQPALYLVLQEHRQAIADAEKRLERLTRQVTEAAETWSMAPVVAAYQALRGVAFLTAVTFVAEIGDVRRFDSPRQLMAYLGLVPSESSTGEQVHRGRITKAGNSRARRVLIEGAWTYRHPARMSRLLQERQADLPPAVREIAWKAQVRLCARYRKLMARGKRGGFKWSSQHPLKGSCDAKSKAAVGTGAAVLTWSPTGDRTRREPAVLGGDCGRYGE
jgi:transposase